MTIKDQFKKIKENWLLIAIALAVIFLIPMGNVITPLAGMSSGSYAKGMAYDNVQSEMASLSRSYVPGPSYEDFAPEVEERKITKSAYISTEVEKGNFYGSQEKLKNIVKTSDSFLLNENVNKQGTDLEEYMYGSYQIKVEVDKYDALVSQLREIGEVQSFNENTVDITGTYTNTQINLELEKEKLKRYQEMYSEATRVEDKITLNDRIFSQERTIKYMEDRLNSLDKKVDYTTVSFTMSEKRSEYMNIAVVKFSELIRSLVNSFNSLLGLLFWALPWAVAILIVGIIWKVVKKRK